MQLDGQRKELVRRGFQSALGTFRLSFDIFASYHYCPHRSYAYGQRSAVRWDQFTLPCTVPLKQSQRCTDLSQAPAETAIAHNLVKFENGISSSTTSYQGPPTQQIDELWEELYAREYSRSEWPHWVQLNTGFVQMRCLVYHMLKLLDFTTRQCQKHRTRVVDTSWS